MSKKFHERFGQHIDSSEAQRRFVNRVDNDIYRGLFYDEYSEHMRSDISKSISFYLGEPYVRSRFIGNYADRDFYETLRVIEAFYRSISRYSTKKERFTQRINSILKESEIDLNVTFINGEFVPKGAELLDDKLIREPLDWIKTPEYKNVYDPYKKALRHFLESIKNPDRLFDVITDCYEAVESLAKIVTGKDRTLDTNIELFVKNLNVSDAYKRMVKEYCKYAHEYRHGLQEGKTRKTPNVAEVESYLYISGLLIRLGVKSKSNKNSVKKNRIKPTK